MWLKIVLLSPRSQEPGSSRQTPLEYSRVQ
ncbi:Protein of unknown function [Pyronema omphalodes CBS 100304]|uniref:Uncharacterized protein n=1 Tax=Pyronema omphalodes (strain CBS 100304) TaxID=1076935 RepID=U4LDQ7_PYROM|nr:Protein of unknown function [Pyronema omphalodes CBS 100304]